MVGMTPRSDPSGAETTDAAESSENEEEEDVDVMYDVQRRKTPGQLLGLVAEQDNNEDGDGDDERLEAIYAEEVHTTPQ